MDKLEKLANEIYNEMLSDGEPVSKEEAMEMAQMELGSKANRRYEQSTNTKRKKSTKERKVDEPKKYLLGELKNMLEFLKCDITEVKTETEIKFMYLGDNYTFKLTRHRPPKK